VKLINWLWWEDLLVRAAEVEVSAFGRQHRQERFFAFCLEYDGLDGSLGFSYGARAEVDAAAELPADDGQPVYYRSIELRPEHWRRRRVPIRDPEGHWSRMAPHFALYREQSQTDDLEAMEFLWLRFEYLAESVVRRLNERDAFCDLSREAEFLAYAANDAERLEEVENRLVKLYPRYRRATAELVDLPEPGEIPPDACEGEDCPRSLASLQAPGVLPPEPWGQEEPLLRCTYCGLWYCAACHPEHRHPELEGRRPFFGEGP